MKITEKQLREIIRESLNSVLSEAAIDREFHYTTLAGLLGIMKNNRIDLNDAELEDGTRFLSLTRARTNTHGYQYGTYSAEGDNTDFPKYSTNYARIEFDGRKLNNIRGAKVRPYDYYYNDDVNSGNVFPVTGKEKHIVDYEMNGGRGGDYEHNHAEGMYRQFWAQSEDRIMSKDDSVPNALRYITRIDVMVKSGGDKDYKDVVRFLSGHPEWKRLFFFHTNDRTFNRPAAEE